VLDCAQPLGSHRAGEATTPELTNFSPFRRSREAVPEE
jgi:hypothetical protein